MSKFSQEIAALDNHELEIALRETYERLDAALPAERAHYSAKAEAIVSRIHDLQPRVEELPIEAQIKALRSAGKTEAADNLQSALDEHTARSKADE